MGEFHGIDLDDGGSETATGETTTAELLDVFRTMQPARHEVPLVRVGGERDGAYLVPDILAGVVACFSPGVNRIKYFEDDLGDTYGIDAHMCDFSCDVAELTTPLRTGTQTFEKKWLDPAPGEDNISLEDWVSRRCPSGDLLLQMDIEGAEYRNLLAAPDELLSRFRVVVLEVHDLGLMTGTAVLRRVVAPFFATLARTFTTVHAHPNNCCGEFTIPGTGISVPNVLELTLVRNDWFTPAAGPPALPHALDLPRNVAANPPLFLSAEWCGGVRPPEAEITMLETLLDYRTEVGTRSEDQLVGLRTLLTRADETAARLPVTTLPAARLAEVAHGCRYELSSAHRGTSLTGTVAPRGNFFFATAEGVGESITIDLGTGRRLRRIELTNRRDGLRERAARLFVTVTAEDGRANVFAVAVGGDDGWDACEVHVPDVVGRTVTIIAPLHTVLHLADVRVFAVDEATPTGSPRQSSRVSLVRRIRRALAVRWRARRG